MPQAVARWPFERSPATRPPRARGRPQEPFLSLLHGIAGRGRREAFWRRGGPLPRSSGDEAQSRPTLSESRRGLSAVWPDVGSDRHAGKRACVRGTRLPHPPRAAENRLAPRTDPELPAPQPSGEPDARQVAPPLDRTFAGRLRRRPAGMNFLGAVLRGESPQIRASFWRRELYSPRIPSSRKAKKALSVSGEGYFLASFCFCFR